MKNKKKSNLFILCIQNDTGNILQPMSFSHNYDELLLKAMDRIKGKHLYWSIFNSSGKTVDSSFKSIVDRLHKYQGENK